MANSDRLSQRSDWKWSSAHVSSLDEVRRSADSTDSIFPAIRRHITDAHQTFLELGCAPGTVSARIVVDTHLQAFGVDYSENSELYLHSLSAIGKDAKLYKEDIFQFQTDRQFDIVGSFGLVEHFEGAELDDLLEIHDQLLKPGGLLIIEIPNFNGIQLFLHKVLDQPNLKIHNLDTMNLEIFDYYIDMGYIAHYKDYFGPFSAWGVSRFKSNGQHTLLSMLFASFLKLGNILSAGLSRIGINTSGPSTSPVILFVATKPKHIKTLTSCKYVQ